MVIGDLIILTLTCQAAMENRRQAAKKNLNKQQQKNLLFNYGQ